MARKRSWQQATDDDAMPSATNDAVFHLKHDPRDDVVDDTQSNIKPPGDDDGWQEVLSQGKKKRRKNPMPGTTNYPSIEHSPNARLQSNVKLSDLQNLILYVLSDGPAPQWVAIRHNNAIRRVVALTIPGFDPELFTSSTPLLDSVEHDEKIETSNDDSVEGSEHKQENSASPKANLQVEKIQLQTKKIALSPDDYYPKKLAEDSLPPILKPFADMFPHIWPVKMPGDEKYAKIHSPMQSMLLTPIPKTKEDKKKKGPTLARTNGPANKPTPITRFIASAEELESNDYVLHPAVLPTETAQAANMALRTTSSQTAKDGWVDINVGENELEDSGTINTSADEATAGRKIIAVDCEMCKTGPEQFELTRISVLDWAGDTILDELVKPYAPITDYLTPYSGITEEMLNPVTTRLEDIQKRLQEIITPSTIIIGHSLDGDFKALRMTYPLIVDTAIIYPHPRGPPLKSSLKWLTQKYLGREIQKSHGSTGHDSVEDARAVLDLVKQKCERGPEWGTSEASSESIFKRLQRSQIPKLFRSNPEVEEFRTGAVVDWGTPSRGLGANADVIIGCENDAEVTESVKKLLNSSVSKEQEKGVDFIWARFREVEAVRGWWEKSKTTDNNELRQKVLGKFSLTEDNVRSENPNAEALSKAVAQTVQHISEIYEALPPCSAFIVYSGHGDPRETFRLQGVHQQFRREYRIKNWDQLSVQWTDVEDQQLRKACKKAREGVAFITVR